MNHLHEDRDRMETTGVLLVIITGILIIAISYALDRLWSAAMPARALYLFVRFPGVVLHECAHIAGCLLTGAPIRSIVFFSQDGGSVTYARPRLPFIGDVIISTAPLFVLPAGLFVITRVFGTYAGCSFPVFPGTLVSFDDLWDLMSAILITFSDNLVTHFNGWFLLYLYLATSIVLSVVPSVQDMKNAAAGSILLILAGILMVWSGIPLALSVTDALLRIMGYGFTLGFVYGMVALVVSLPLMLWYGYRHCS